MKREGKRVNATFLGEIYLPVERLVHTCANVQDFLMRAHTHTHTRVYIRNNWHCLPLSTSRGGENLIVPVSCNLEAIERIAIEINQKNGNRSPNRSSKGKGLACRASCDVFAGCRATSERIITGIATRANQKEFAAPANALSLIRG